MKISAASTGQAIIRDLRRDNVTMNNEPTELTTTVWRDGNLVSDPNLIIFTSSLHFRAWVKKTDSELEAAARAAQAEEDKDIPILPYSSLFILSSENK